MRRRLFCVLLLSAPTLFAAEQTPAFLQPEVLKAALEINLTDAQKPQFQQALTDFINGRVQAFNKIMRGHNQSNIERKMKSRTNALLKQMDRDMAAFLTESQMPAYEKYREALKAHLRG